MYLERRTRSFIRKITISLQELASKKHWHTLWTICKCGSTKQHIYIHINSSYNVTVVNLILMVCIVGVLTTVPWLCMLQIDMSSHYSWIRDVCSMKCSSKTHLLGKKLHSLSYTFRVAQISYIGRVIVK